MKKIPINNKDLLDVLKNISDWFDTCDIENQVKFRHNSKLDLDEYYTNEEYLNNQMQDKDHDGFGATESYGVDINWNEDVSPEVRQKRFEIDQALKPILSSPNSAVKMYYPENGFMHWHNNHNVPGYNILLSYTKNGNGWFRYRDPITHEIVTMHDEPGWTAKVGYYGTNDEPDKLYWHCARAYEDRFTLGYIIPNHDMWQMMCDDIQDH